MEALPRQEIAAAWPVRFDAYRPFPAWQWGEAGGLEPRANSRESRHACPGPPESGPRQNFPQCF